MKERLDDLIDEMLARSSAASSLAPSPGPAATSEQAAKLLGIHRITLSRKVSAYRLTRWKA